MRSGRFAKGLDGKVILVTGGAGFIGSNFIRYVKKCFPGALIVCFDKLTYAADLGNITDDGRLICELFKGDIASDEDVRTAFERYQPDCVVNFAAESHVDRSIENADPFIRTNVYGTVTLLDNILRYQRKHGVKIRFHQISTDEVYGDLPICSYEASIEPFTEDSPMNPSNPYAASKASADMFVLSYFRTYGLDLTVSRSSNNFGKYQNEEKFIPHSVKSVMRGEKIRIYGDGQNRREWFFVEDHCRAVCNILLYGELGNIYNVRGKNSLSNNELTAEILKILGLRDDRYIYVPDRPGHDRSYLMNCDKYYRRFGEDSDNADFSNTLKDTVLYYAEKFSK